MYALIICKQIVSDISLKQSINEYDEYNYLDSIKDTILRYNYKIILSSLGGTIQLGCGNLSCLIANWTRLKSQEFSLRRL